MRLIKCLAFCCVVHIMLSCSNTGESTPEGQPIERTQKELSISTLSNIGLDAFLDAGDTIELRGDLGVCMAEFYPSLTIIKMEDSILITLSEDLFPNNFASSMAFHSSNLHLVDGFIREIAKQDTGRRQGEVGDIPFMIIYNSKDTVNVSHNGFKVGIAYDELVKDLFPDHPRFEYESMVKELVDSVPLDER